MNQNSRSLARALHPCQTCGACCAAFRVSFYWSEASDGDGGVPQEMTVRVGPHLSAMKGTTERGAVRCTALEGKVGARVYCTIYEERPTPCRDFKASFEDGVADERCDQVRATRGLPPLRAEDFETPNPQLPAPSKQAA